MNNLNINLENELSKQERKNPVEKVDLLTTSLELKLI